MKYNPDTHNRRSIRLKGYDYSQAGGYFVTICALGRECLFGHIANGEMELNETGRMVQTVWDEIPSHYPGVGIDEFVIMPNHVHGIIMLVGAGSRACPDAGIACPDAGHPKGGTMSLPDVVHRFKTMATKRYRDGHKLWHRNYYEHIIRNENELSRIQEYIINNPSRWTVDRENRNIPPENH